MMNKTAASHQNRARQALHFALDHTANQFKTVDAQRKIITKQANQIKELERELEKLQR